ncbi:MAG: serine hydrolase [Myxococcota bacterium]
MMLGILGAINLGAPLWDTACPAPIPLQHKDPLLGGELALRLRQAGLREYLDNRSLAVAVLDLTWGAETFYAGFNDDEMLYAASLPKIAILLSVAHLANRGDIVWDSEFPQRLEKMITVSSNRFASWGVDVAGLAGIAAVVQDPQYCLYTAPAGGLWVGRAFRKTHHSRRDPLHDISHGATARQTVRLYALLDQGRGVSPYWSARMLDLMGPPGHHHKFVGGIGERSGVHFVARKSGTWRHFHADSALVQHAHARYIVVGLSELARGEKIMRRLSQIVDDVILAGDHRRR